jgi:hypothetical protein
MIADGYQKRLSIQLDSTERTGVRSCANRKLKTEIPVKIMSTPDLIQRRLGTFWGYGSLEAPVWFVGMEEGLGETDTEELEIRFRAADGKPTVDMRRDMRDLNGHMKWFKENPPLQATWKYPIALYLYLHNHRAPSQQEIRDHQRSVLGDIVRKESSTIELMPLPSHKADESAWVYNKYGVPGLNSRKEYLATYKPRRVAELKQLVKTSSPKLVIFYSIGYLREWTEIIGNRPEEITHQMYFANTEKTAFCILPQGTSFGMSYERLYEFAEKIQGRVTI